MRLAVGLALALLLLAGCSGSPTAEPESAPSSPAEHVETPSATTAPKTSATPSRDPLADLVEGIDPDTLVEEDVLGADVSWPQCPKGMGIPQKRSHGAPMPIEAARFVIIGLTNGPGFYPNPCLAAQTTWARQRGLWTAAYAVVSYPEERHRQEFARKGPFDGGTELGALANVGYQQARFNLRSLRAAGLRTPIVWLDVEPVPHFAWSADPQANAAVLTGSARAYEDAGYRIGVYSTPSLWRGIVGDLELGLPEWRAAGQTSKAEALSRCGSDWVIQGGEAVLGQWVEADRDQNITCPGTIVMGDWFSR